MTRLPVLLVLASFLLAAAPLTAMADHCRDCACPTYTHSVTASRTTLWWNDDFQMMVDLGDAPADDVRYVTVDELFLLTPGARDGSAVFAIYVYPEANGQQGMQRDDETCSNCHYGEGCEAPDTILP